MKLAASCICLLLLAGELAAAEADALCRDCDRQMRKTFEAIQAWRRVHGGRYPARLVDLKTSGLLPADGAICPDVLQERLGADAAHSDTTSRHRLGDPADVYEYEMSATVDLRGQDRLYLPEGAPSYMRQDLKAELLRRKFSEQVAMLRCSSHRAVAPPPYEGRANVRRNITVEGKIYWSGRLWEQLWLEDVPYCARDANVLYGLKGPPFHVDRAPAFAEALDLRKWSCAFGDHPWWWTHPIFDERPNRQTAPHLRPFFQEQHGRAITLGSNHWWLNGLVQLQGQVSNLPADRYRAPGMEAFVWKRTGVQVNQQIEGATWLQGTVWTAAEGDTVGSLVWHYSNGGEETVPIIYGKTTARFWAQPAQIEQEKGFLQPVWSHYEDENKERRERWLRIYQQEWRNPRPDLLVTTVDFVSNQQCPAAPFLVAATVIPRGAAH
ncbi:MAG TPA: hypothetical protein VNU68_19380 [Verrucomicrobiae bacterium]|nr:hypothetical protein [Verrucomicrobiae bacterium]